MEKQEPGCNEAYGGGWIMRGRESEPKVRRKSGNEMGRGGGSLRRHTGICVFKKLRSCSFALKQPGGG